MRGQLFLHPTASRSSNLGVWQRPRARPQARAVDTIVGHLRLAGPIDVTPTWRSHAAGYQPHFGNASTLVPFVSVMRDAVPEPSALITKISLLTRAEHGARRAVPDT